jgi:hypothetical protein
MSAENILLQMELVKEGKGWAIDVLEQGQNDDGSTKT